MTSRLMFGMFWDSSYYGVVSVGPLDGLKGALRSDFTPIFYLLILIYRMKK